MFSHVLVLASWYPSDAHDVSGVFFRDQAQALAKYGHKVGVVAVYMRSLRTLGRKASQQAGPLYEVDEGIPTYRRRIWAALPRMPYGNYLLYKRAVESLLWQYVRERGWPDLIHAHCAIYAGAVAAEWGWKRGVPVVMTEHSSGFARQVYRPWQLRLAGQAATGAKACIAVSPALGELLDRQLSWTRSRWQWVPNVVAGRFYDRKKAVLSVARPKRFLNLALMTENKGQADLLEAFARAYVGKMDAAELWLGGDGPIRKALENRSATLGIASQVQFLGRIPPSEVPSLFGQVDVMVVSSHYETFGVVAAEALMAGVPVVATRCGGPECIVGEGDGRLVPPRDPEALARAMMEVGDQAASADSHAIAARAWRRFSGESVARQLTEIYDGVLSGSAPVTDTA